MKSQVALGYFQNHLQEVWQQFELDELQKNLLRLN
jgi:hypothetical protein